MTSALCRLPDELAQDIEQHARDVDRFLKGGLSASILKSRRVPRGIYEQRQNGTYMVRVRVPGGAISAAQARALAETASRYGNGILHVTTRQDIQIHGVKIEQTPAIMRELFRAGLTSKGGGGNTVRNVTACPFAGICPAERFDVTPFVVGVTGYLIALPGSYNLPRKYKIAFSGCSADCALAQVNDLGFIAQVRDGVPGFSVYAGGGMGAESRVGDRMEEWAPASEVIRIAEAVRRLFDRLGDRRNRRRARLRFAVERVGADAFRGMLRAAVQTVTDDGVPAGEVPLDLAEAPTEPPRDSRALLTHAGDLDLLRQRQPGHVAVPLRLPLGQISWKILAALAELAERFSAEKMLRATQDQNLLLRFVREADLDALRKELDRVLGPAAIRHAAGHSFNTCTGAATCRLGLCLSQNAARACADTLADAGLDPATLQAVDIRINGCPNACGQHPIGTIGLFGAALRVGERLAPAYRVLLGARRGEGRTRLGAAAGAVPARTLPAFLADLLNDFQAGRTPDESFADYFDRKGMSHFQSVLARHTRTPDYADDPAFYRDWGSDEDFTLAGRGAGECGAGVFEVIAEDLAAAAKAMEQAETDTEPGAALFRGLLAASRALLITRGLDSQDTDVILRSFETHFLDTGLVDADFHGLLARGRAYREGWREALAGRREEILRLLDRVEQLYSTMDAELRFHVPETAPSTSPPAAPPTATPGGTSDGGATATAELDLRGVACPMNFVKAKLRLETLEAGATLGLLLDDGAPVQNVPASFRNEGQEVVEILAAGDGHWRVLIRKKT
ncbi:MAG: sulfurtransferase TusA family protein [Kiritimatiellia bacterium]